MTRKRKERSGGPLAIAKSDRSKRETNTQAVEARKQKRLKKRKGLASGNKTAEAEKGKKGTGGPRKSGDPRIGSKAPIQLVSAPTPVAQPAIVKVKQPKAEVKPVAPVLTFEQELDKLESDARLNGLLLRLDNNEVLNHDDQDYVDQGVERHAFLLEELGYADDEEFDEEYDEAEWDEAMMAELDAKSLNTNTEQLSEDELYERFLATEKKLKNNDNEG
ncbi:Der GTPase-activating protein YihI [Moritella sp. F3]|uniref:Der GTPase-activating protein YihI n=1 Tax=Moritella sp. F3 TaxID=2718882 RepID=UPI0018E1A837|nr:Der GTPase-activating protein YihI [Moritella sp. F3]GIC77356.1 Der GTPase-activating protein YihI [Moritella sp. F1]GIC83279.1 Der GTPase-activating protein YihI [Moritella sp. F3]